LALCRPVLMHSDAGDYEILNPQPDDEFACHRRAVNNEK
jgi:hypothetical protein